MKINSLYHWIITGFISLLILYTLHPYYLVITWAALISIMLYPIYSIFKDWSSKRQSKLAALLTIMLFTFIILIPISIFTVFLFNNLIEFISKPHALQNMMINVNQSIKSLPFIGNIIGNYLHDTATTNKIASLFNINTIKQFIPLVQETGSSALSFFSQVFVMLFLIFQMIISAEPIKKFLLSEVLHGLKNKETMLIDINNNIRSILYIMLLTGLISGATMTAVYATLGLKFWPILGGITGLTAIIPFMLPIFYILLSTILILNHMLASALIIICIGLTLNFLTDNIMQPFLLSQRGDFNYALTLLGIFSGLQVFGILGILLGPLILNTALKMYKLRH